MTTVKSHLTSLTEQCEQKSCHIRQLRAALNELRESEVMLNNMLAKHKEMTVPVKDEAQ